MGRTMSAETRAKMSAAAQARLSDPDERARIGASMRAAFADPARRREILDKRARTRAAKRAAQRVTPPWCPPALAAIYETLARARGEEKAAQLVREAKRELGL